MPFSQVNILFIFQFRGIAIHLDRFQDCQDYVLNSSRLINPESSILKKENRVFKVFETHVMVEQIQEFYELYQIQRTRVRVIVHFFQDFLDVQYFEFVQTMHFQYVILESKFKAFQICFNGLLKSLKFLFIFILQTLND